MNEAGPIQIVSQTFPRCWKPRFGVDVDNNPVSQRWWVSHVLAGQTMREDVVARNAALQRHLKEQRRLRGKGRR